MNPKYATHSERDGAPKFHINTIVSTNMLDVPVKVAILFALPALSALWVGLSTAGRVLLGVGYGFFFTPWDSAFEAFRHDNEFKKFLHCIVVTAKTLQIWEKKMRSCKARGKEFIDANVITMADLSEWLKAKNGDEAAIIGGGLPSCSSLQNIRVGQKISTAR